MCMYVIRMEHNTMKFKLICIQSLGTIKYMNLDHSTRAIRTSVIIKFFLSCFF